MFDVKRKRLEAGLTQEQLSEALGVHQTAVSQWERGIAQPRGAVIPKLLKVLNCKIEDIYAEEVPTECPKSLS